MQGAAVSGGPGCLWAPRSIVPPLAPREVHLWAIELDEPAAVEPARQLLSPDEQERADRFRFEKHRRRFTLGRAAQRQILAGYLAAEAAELVFDYSPLGKPSLAEPWSVSGLCFNLSNSHELALLAVTQCGPCGVDVEYLHRRCDHAGLAERYFSPPERIAVLSHAEPDRRDAFFRCWTRKEAMLKATGTGLTFPLDRFVVTLGRGETPRVVSIEGDAARGAAWRLAHLEPGQDYFAALASEHPIGEIRTWRWKQ